MLVYYTQFPDFAGSSRPSSSPRFCKPIRIQLVYETTDASKKEMEYIEYQISSLLAVNVENTYFL